MTTTDPRREREDALLPTATVPLGDVDPARSRHAGRRSAVALLEVDGNEVGPLAVTGLADGSLVAVAPDGTERWRYTGDDAGSVVTLVPFAGGVLVGERGHRSRRRATRLRRRPAVRALRRRVAQTVRECRLRVRPRRRDRLALSHGRLADRRRRRPRVGRGSRERTRGRRVQPLSRHPRRRPRRAGEPRRLPRLRARPLWRRAVADRPRATDGVVTCAALRGDRVAAVEEPVVYHDEGIDRGAYRLHLLGG